LKTIALSLLTRPDVPTSFPHNQDPSKVAATALREVS